MSNTRAWSERTISQRFTLSRRELLALLGGGAAASFFTACSPSSESPGSGVIIDGPLHYASLIDISKMIKAQELSPVELTQMMLARIEAIDDGLNSYLTLMAEHAVEAARVAEQEIQAGDYKGPLHGVPIAVKDLCYTRGVHTTGGLAVLADFVPDYDATVVTRLSEAGGVILGKLNLTEGAMGGYHRDFEIPVNPWDDALSASASSSGPGVATAAGLCFASLGTDTGGSIRFPSMANGIVGLKPTYGRVSRYGVLALAESLDHVGPMARNVADAAAVFEVIAGADANDPTSLSSPVPDMLGALTGDIRGLRIGFDQAYATDGVDPGLVASIEVALAELENLGAQVVEVKMPEFTPGHIDTWFAICSYEAVAAHARTYPSRAADYGAYFREFLETGTAITDEAYAEAGRVRKDFSDRFRAALSSVDAVVCPAGGVPSLASADIGYGGMPDPAVFRTRVGFRFTFPANFAGTPTITLPCGVNEAGVPYAVQFMGSRLGEPLLLRIAHAYEQSTDWHIRHPSV